MDRSIIIYKPKHGLMFLLIFFTGFSYLDRKFYPGRSEIVSVGDSTLNDSSLFTGYVFYNREDSAMKFPADGAIISIINKGINISADLSGYYKILVLPGTYTLLYQAQGNEWPQLIGEVKNITIKKNQTIRIDIFLGSYSD